MLQIRIFLALQKWLYEFQIWEIANSAMYKAMKESISYANNLHNYMKASSEQKTFVIAKHLVEISKIFANLATFFLQKLD